MKGRYFDQRWLMPGVAKEMRRVAFLGALDYAHPDFRNTDYRDRCTACHKPTGTVIIFTRDTGHHSCGWWKNPDYESCLHLSLSFRDVETGEYASKNEALTRDWIDHFFGDNKSLLWIEPPHSDKGKQADSWHYRLFVHSDWQTPLLPRGEVYSREFTEAGWKSWSDVHADIEQCQKQIIERANS